MVLAAAASIATSTIDTWVTDDEAELPLTTLEPDAVKLLTIHAELHEAGAIVERGGYAEVVLSLTAAGVADGESLYVRLTSLANPDVAMQYEAVTIRGGAGAATWLTCEAEPCVEEFQLELERLTGTQGTIQVAGTVTVAATGEGPMPEGAAIVIIGIAEAAPP